MYTDDIWFHSKLFPGELSLCLQIPRLQLKSSISEACYLDQQTSFCL